MRRGPFVLALADKGFPSALIEDAHLRNGLNIHEGNITCRAVADALGWDFHLPAGGSWQLIELNDNGSGFLFAAIINAVYYGAAGLGPEQGIAPPAGLPAFGQLIVRMVEQEAKGILWEAPYGFVSRPRRGGIAAARQASTATARPFSGSSRPANSA